MKVFYHCDDDGKCAAFWVKHLATHQDNYTREFVEINYGKAFPMETILPEEQVYIVDFSIEPNEMKELLSKTSQVTWIDHHITAINKYKDFDESIRGIRYDGVAGCMLTYCYLTHMTNHGIGKEKTFQLNMTLDAPMFTKLIADYDVWTFTYGVVTSYFHMGLNIENKQPESEMWIQLLRDHTTVDDIIQTGILLTDFQEQEDKQYCESYGYEIEFEGHHCFVVNRGMVSSNAFTSQNEKHYDMYIGWTYDGEQYRYSLRSEIVDVSQIASKYGGGGHKGAAGFTSKEFVLAKS